VAQALSCRPSALLGVDEEYAAFCLDEACVYFGEIVRAEVSAVEDKNPRMLRGKRENVLRGLLGLPKRYADPFAGRR
jgi:hypothetical protein